MHGGGLVALKIIWGHAVHLRFSEHVLFKILLVLHLYYYSYTAKAFTAVRFDHLLVSIWNFEI